MLKMKKEKNPKTKMKKKLVSIKLSIHKFILSNCISIFKKKPKLKKMKKKKKKPMKMKKNLQVDHCTI